MCRICAGAGLRIKKFFSNDASNEKKSLIVQKTANGILMRSFLRGGCPINIEPRTPNWKLRVLNICVGIFQLFTSIILFGISDPNKKWPWYTYFTGESDTGPFGDPDAEKVANIPIGYFSGIFLFMSFLDHILVSFPGIWQIYKYFLRTHQNHFRWIEYAFSAGLMHVMIAQLSGVTDIHLLYAIFGLTMGTMFFGSVHEQVNSAFFGRRPTATDIESNASDDDSDCEKVETSTKAVGSKSWLPLFYGFVQHFFVWTIIACYFFQAVSKGDPPAFVWAIIFILFFLDLMFAVMLLVQWLEIGIFKDNYIIGEIGFIFLSLTSKQLLAWINYGGSQR